MASKPKDYTIFIWIILTSNTEATENEVQFLNFAYTVKGSTTAWIKGKKQQQNKYTLFKCFLCDIL